MAIRTFLADDNIQVVDMLSDVLMLEGDFEIVGRAYDGRAALEGVARTRPELLLLDLIMPQTDGFGVLEALEEPRPRVAVFSALGRDDMTMRALELGADAYFIKPFDFALLKARLLHLMGQTAETQPQTRWEGSVAQALHAMGMPPHIKGYRYFQTAIAMVLKEGGVVRGMGRIYEAVAQEYDTTPNRAERMMRHAVECAWDRSSAKCIEEYFGYTVDADKGKPSNSEFIAMLADRILLERR
ncbi:MAG: sporulation transcription factor Spo0A [Eubacteriales bacterium]|nr:sporulation transcription factor Spo0A [Eubacteriales bacterium]